MSWYFDKLGTNLTLGLLVNWIEHFTLIILAFYFQITPWHLNTNQGLDTVCVNVHI